MAFDQSTITEASATWDGPQVHASWTSTAPAGTWFQVYVGRKLAGWTKARSLTVPAPTHKSRIDVGAVLPSERAVDLSATLPASPSDRVTLSWQGGTFQGDGIAGFRVYGGGGFGSGGFGSGGFGTGSTPLATISAYTPGVYTDGFGFGGFGDGGFGAAAGSYSWTSDALANGDWTFAVVPFDSAGNEGAPVTATATIAAPPEPPAADATGRRLTYSYNQATHIATLAWLASPE